MLVSSDGAMAGGGREAPFGGLPIGADADLRITISTPSICPGMIGLPAQRGAEGVGGTTRPIEARIRARLPELFHAVPKAEFEVRPLPSLGEQRGTGNYRVGPADASGPGILFFNMAKLDARPIPTLETLTLHEGLPGHHYQL